MEAFWTLEYPQVVSVEVSAQAPKPALESEELRIPGRTLLLLRSPRHIYDMLGPRRFTLTAIKEALQLLSHDYLAAGGSIRSWNCLINFCPASTRLSLYDRCFIADFAC